MHLKHKKKELTYIKRHSHKIKNFNEIDDIEKYPKQIKKIIKKIKRIHFDKIIKFFI